MKLFSKEKPKEEKPLNTLKSEHLKEGVSPIIACIGTPEQFKEGEVNFQEIFSNSLSNENSNSNRNVDYYGQPDELKRQRFKNAGYHSYVISSIDSSNKFSGSFKNCTGFIATGSDKETGKEISFLSHQDPEYFLKNIPSFEKFVDDFKKQLLELKERCANGTIDAVIVGGNYFNERPEFRDNYLTSIGLISKEVRTILGFEPVVMTGPKTVSGKDDIFYDNDHRRLYITRPEVAKESTKSYLPSDIDSKERNW